MTQDEQQLEVLAILHYVFGGLTALFSCFFLFHMGLGIAMSSGAMDGPGNHLPHMIGWLMALFAGCFVLIGWILGGLIIAAGRKLKRRRAYGFCFVMACLECMLMPLGTVLGVFTIVLLSKDPVKKLFSPASPNNSATPPPCNP